MSRIILKNTFDSIWDSMALCTPLYFCKHFPQPSDSACKLYASDTLIPRGESAEGTITFFAR